MAKKTVHYICAECGDSFPTWYGRCPSCAAFGSFSQFREAKTDHSGDAVKDAGVDLTTAKQPMAYASTDRIVSDIHEFDRAVGGGLMPGGVTLLAGPPGIGKSTLALQVFGAIKGAMYISGEESVSQIAPRAQRLDITNDQIYSTNGLADIIETLTAKKPTVVVIDSIQMVGDVGMSLGTQKQMREAAEALVRCAKATGTHVVLIGHVTKAEQIAGPRVLEHMVDTVLTLEGEKHTELRILRSLKNRFGPTDEVGVFTMENGGMVPLSDPGAYFLAERPVGAPGSAVTVLREGNRSFLLEVQALTVKTHFGQARRTTSGFPVNRFHVLLAVLERFTPLGCAEYDAYLNVVGGLSLNERATDLAVCAAVLSSRIGVALPADMVVLGEVGLAGEVRHVQDLQRRLEQAQRMGFSRAMVPEKDVHKMSPDMPMELVSVGSIAQAFSLLFPKGKKKG